ncbi:MAG: type IV toxin-antitoxin system AbiEi family antitoxin domain-containing protein [Acidimicrobiales bacterium]
MQWQSDVARLAQRQHGIVTLGEALQLGMTRAQVRHQVESGAWVRLVGGVFRIAGAPVTFPSRVVAACRAAGPRAVASHRCAARLLGVGTGLVPEVVEITVPLGRSVARARSLGAEVHFSRRLTNADMGSSTSGVAVTRPVRMVLECANQLTYPDFCLLLDETMVRYRLRASSIRRAHHRLGWRRGGAALERALSIYGSGPTSDSPPEVRLARRLVDSGLPAPELLAAVVLAGGRVVEGDLAYRAERVIIDYHGKLSHTARHLTHDAARSNAIQAAGWVHLTATDADLLPGAAVLTGTVTQLLVERTEASRHTSDETWARSG